MGLYPATSEQKERQGKLDSDENYVGAIKKVASGQGV